MTLSELNKYRLTSMEEPSDEALAQIMREAVADAKKKAEEAEKAYFDRIWAAAKRISEEQNDGAETP